MDPCHASSSQHASSSRKFLDTHHVQPDVKFRDSTTAGSDIGIVQNTHTDGKGSGGKSTAVEITTVSLSNEDDSAERESILQSPPKRVQRLSSTVS